MLSLVNFSIAQPKPVINTLPDGGQVIDQGPIPGENLTDKFTREIKNKDKITTERITWIRDGIGGCTFKREVVEPNGNATKVTEGKMRIIDGKLVVTEYKTEYKDNNVVTKTEEGSRTSDGNYNTKTTVRGSGGGTTEGRLPDSDAKDLNGRFQLPIHDNQPPPTGGSTEHSSLPGDVDCRRQLAVMLGPSYLSRDFGDEKESMWGVNLVANYHLTAKISAGLDIGMYTKDVMEEQLCMGYYMADVEYLFGKKEKDCDRPISIFSRVMIGQMKEKYYDIKETGLVYGAGAGADFRLNNSFHVRVGFDYLVGKIGEDDVNSFRVGVMASWIKTRKIAP